MSFSIDNRAKNLPDVQKQFLFELEMPAIGGVTEEDMIVRVRSAVIPQRAIEVIESNFMGMKQFFPGRPSFSHTLTVDFEEFEDQKVLTHIYEWFEKITVIDPADAQSGVAKKSESKKTFAQDITLRMYSTDGTELDKTIVFYNAYPETLSDSTLGYANNDSVKMNVTFRFDYWLLKD